MAPVVSASALVAADLVWEKGGSIFVVLTCKLLAPGDDKLRGSRRWQLCTSLVPRKPDTDEWQSHWSTFWESLINTCEMFVTLFGGETPTACFMPWSPTRLVWGNPPEAKTRFPLAATLASTRFGQARELGPWNSAGE
jgi:hypothetical protein